MRSQIHPVTNQKSMYLIIFKNCFDLSLFQQIVLVISIFLQILGLQPRISKVFLNHQNNFFSKQIRTTLVNLNKWIFLLLEDKLSQLAKQLPILELFSDEKKVFLCVILHILSPLSVSLNTSEFFTLIFSPINYCFLNDQLCRTYFSCSFNLV